jgi:hypothetical protein
MRKIFFRLVLVIASSSAMANGQANSGRINLKLNADEAKAVLAILDKENSKQDIADSDWQNLFSTEPYLRLKKREAAMHREFTDDDFKKFVLSPELLAKKEALRRTLEEWETADLQASARRVLDYLPDSATIRAKVYPVIKPKSNSFVFETDTDPAIFLYLDPAESRARFENTVAHELHHIGFSSVSSLRDERLKDVPPSAKAAVDWMGGFGEGFAMLAAAGGPDTHPHAVSTPEERAEWDHDMANFNQDLLSLQQFFLDGINQKFKSKDELDAKGSTFFGKQGPWYTVGYKMAVIVEKRYGRAVLIDCMIDPRELLVRYNRAAAELNRNQAAQLELWSPELLAKIEPMKIDPAKTEAPK